MRCMRQYLRCIKSPLGFKVIAPYMSLALHTTLKLMDNLEKKHQLQLLPEKSGLERLVDIKDSLTRARDKMALLIDSTLESSERSKRDTGMIT